MNPNEFFDCPRIYKALDMMRKCRVCIDELDITVEEISKLIELGINIVNVPKTNIYYIDSNNSESMYEIVSLKSRERRLVRWVEAGALYAGHRTFDKEAFEYFLSEAVRRGYEEVHFSGDLCAGPPPKAKRNKQSEWVYWTHEKSFEQAELIVNILKKFPTLRYYAIHGVNEVAFEKTELNPLILVQRDLKSENIEFNYKPTATLNLVTAGIVQRIVYLEKRRSYTVSYQSEFYMDEQYAKMVDNVVIKGKDYKLMFVQFGGAMENSLNKNGNNTHPIYMTTNSGFIRDTTGAFHSATTYPSIRFCDAWIQNGSLVETFKTSICVK